MRRLALRAARSLVGLLPAGARELQHAARRSLGECRSVARAHAYAWRGDIVICDRHPLELLLVGEPRPGATGLLERAVRERLLPHPDALVLLDGPAELMYDRKGEHSVQLLERQRTRYRDALVPRGATVVSTGGSPEESLAGLSTIAWDALSARAHGARPAGVSGALRRRPSRPGGGTPRRAR